MHSKNLHASTHAGSEFIALIYLQHAGVAREILAASIPHHHHILKADAAQRRIIQAGLDGDDLARHQGFAARRDARGFVNFESNAVPGSMEEADLTSPPESGDIALLYEK